MNFKTIFLLLIIPACSILYISASSSTRSLSTKSDQHISVSQLVHSWGYRPAAAFILATKRMVHPESGKFAKISNPQDINVTLYGLLKPNGSLDATEKELYTIMGHVKKTDPRILDREALLTASLALIRAEADYLKTLEGYAQKANALATPSSQTEWAPFFSKSRRITKAQDHLKLDLDVALARADITDWTLKQAGILLSAAPLDLTEKPVILGDIHARRIQLAGACNKMWPRDHTYSLDSSGALDASFRSAASTEYRSDNSKKLA